ncbi:MAG: hypothetical protein AB7N76_22185 [Planctomycetota bacterium]
MTDPGERLAHLGAPRTLLRLAGRAGAWAAIFGLFGWLQSPQAALGAACMAVVWFAPPAVVELDLERDPAPSYARAVGRAFLATSLGVVIGLFNAAYLDALWQGGGVAAATGKLIGALSRLETWFALACLCLMIGGVMGLAAGFQAPLSGRARAGRSVLLAAALAASTGLVWWFGFQAPLPMHPALIAATLFLGLPMYATLVVGAYWLIDRAVGWLTAARPS